MPVCIRSSTMGRPSILFCRREIYVKSALSGKWDIQCHIHINKCFHRNIVVNSNNLCLVKTRGTKKESANTFEDKGIIYKLLFTCERSSMFNQNVLPSFLCLIANKTELSCSFVKTVALWKLIIFWHPTQPGQNFLFPVTRLFWIVFHNLKAATAVSLAATLQNFAQNFGFCSFARDKIMPNNARTVDVVYDWAVCSRSLFCWKQ